MPRGNWSIRTWLGSLVTAVALPLLLLLVWIFTLQVRRELREARETALRMARAAALRIGAQHESSSALLRQMARRPAIRDFDGATCDSLFAIVDFFPQWADLLLYDRAGRVVCSANPGGEDRNISLAAQQWLAHTVITAGEPAVLLVGQQCVSVVSAPVSSSGGMLVLLQALDLRAEPLPPHSVLTILDRRGNVLVRAIDGAAAAGGNAARSEVAQIALQQREGTAAAGGLDGVSRQYGFTTVPQLGWIVYVGVPTAAVMQPVRSLFTLGVAGGIAIIAVITIVAVMLSRAVERPVGALVKAAESAAQLGYGKAEEAGGPREIVRLSGAFNEMMERRSESERHLKALSERLLVVQEQERMRVAREIHDDLGQSLTALKMDVIGLLEKTAPRPELKTMIDRILQTLDDAVTAVQRISSELRPSILDDLGLFAAVELEMQTFEERTGIECELSIPESPPALDKAAATAIYRMVQEALTNVARHSNASRVELRVRERGGHLLLEIRDDGRGISDEQLTDPASLGLAGIRERAEILGGTAHFEGVPGRGTIVSIRLPLAALAEGAP